MRIKGGLLLLVASLLAVLVSGGFAATRAPQTVPVKREILALYDGAQEGEADWTRIHRFAELPLNHLGFVLRFHDVRTKLPEPAEVERYRGVLTWFVGAVPNSLAYLAWTGRVSRLNVRYVILGDVGVPVDSRNILAVNRLLDAAGVRHTGDRVSPTLATRVVQKDPGLTEFECRLDPVLPDYPVVQVSRPGTRVGLALETPAYDGKRQTAVVAIGPKGGYAALGYEFCHQRPPLYQGKWLIDPFAFFRAAFAVDDGPIPDTTTVSGNRLYFSRLDSEGWGRASRIEGFRETAATAGDVVLRELIERFGNLPTTITVREKDFGKSARARRKTQQNLQRAIARRNVDVSQREFGTALSRFDQVYPSISNLAPLLSANPGHLVLAPMSEDAGYSGSAVGESGFFALQNTIAKTESPRRLKLFNLNYHAYAGEYPAQLKSVRELLRAADQSALTPVSANRYAAIVDGFLNARIERLAESTWRIANRGALQTVRFDGAGARAANLRSSVGVIGQQHVGTTLYVALDEAVEPAVIVIDRLGTTEQARAELALVQSRWRVRHVVKDECRLRFEAQGFGEGAFVWSGAEPARRYVITVARGGRQLSRQTTEADHLGTLQFVVPVDAIDPVTVQMNCASAGSAAAQ